MRAEERHKLQHNELSDWLAKWIEQAKPYANVALLGVLLVVLAVLAYIWWNRQSTDQAVAAWDGVYQGLSTGNPETFEGVWQNNPGSDAADWARVLAGDVYLSNGCQQLFENKSKAIDDLGKAVDQYGLVQEQSRESALRERATFGLARAYEALAGTEASTGSTDKGSGQFKTQRELAIAEYEKVLADWPNGAYKDLAARRIEELNRGDIKAFYDDFATKFDPQPAATDIPGLSGDTPEFSLDALSEGTGLPGLPDDMAPEEGAATTEDEAPPPTEGDESGAEPTEAMGAPGATLPGTLPITPAKLPAGDDEAKPAAPEAGPSPTAKAPVEKPTPKTEPSASKPAEAKEPSGAP